MRDLMTGMKNAMAGFRHTLKSEPNMKLHAVAAVLVITSGVLLQIDRLEWALIAMCIGMVVSMECMNTAVERLADRVTANDDPLIKNAKDAAAGAVLVVSAVSVVVALLIFVPKLV